MTLPSTSSAPATGSNRLPQKGSGLRSVHGPGRREPPPLRAVVIQNAKSRPGTVDDPANARMSVSVRWLQWSMAAAPVSTAIITAGPGAGLVAVQA